MFLSHPFVKKKVLCHSTKVPKVAIISNRPEQPITLDTWKPWQTPHTPIPTPYVHKQSADLRLVDPLRYIIQKDHALFGLAAAQKVPPRSIRDHPFRARPPAGYHPFVSRRPREFEQRRYQRLFDKAWRSLTSKETWEWWDEMMVTSRYESGGVLKCVYYICIYIYTYFYVYETLYINILYIYNLSFSLL